MPVQGLNAKMFRIRLEWREHGSFYKSSEWETNLSKSSHTFNSLLFIFPWILNFLIIILYVQALSVQFSSVAQSCPTLCNPMNGRQHARPPCPSPTPRVYSNSCPSGSLQRTITGCSGLVDCYDHKNMCDIFYNLEAKRIWKITYIYIYIHIYMCVYNWVILLYTWK